MEDAHHEDAHHIDSAEALRALYGTPLSISLDKESPVLTDAYRRWIERAAFMAIASVGEHGLDCSPRGDREGELLRVLDERTLAIPDRRGNNRLDTLGNLVADPRIALLFLIPGITETLRVRGRARLTTEPGLLASFAVRDRPPTSVVVVAIETVYFQCGRAVKRAGLWDADNRVESSAVPSAGQMTKSSLPEFDADGYDAALPERHRQTLY